MIGETVKLTETDILIIVALVLVGAGCGLAFGVRVLGLALIGMGCVIGVTIVLSRVVQAVGARRGRRG